MMNLVSELILAAYQAASAEAALQAVLSRLCRGIGWELGHVYLPSLDGSQMLPSEIWYFETQEPFQEFRQQTMQIHFERGEGLIGRVMESRQAAWITDMTLDPTFKRRGHSHLKTGFAFPVIAGDATIAILECYSTTSAFPEPAVLEMLPPLAKVLSPIISDKQQGNMAAIARDITARKQAEAEEREQRLLAEALHDTLAALTSTLDLDQVLTRILKTVGRLVPHDAANIQLIHNNRIRVVYHHNYTDAQVELMNTYVDIAQYETVRGMIMRGEPSLVPEVSTQPGWQVIPGMEWIQSYVGVPLRQKGKIIGFLNLDSRTPNFFTPKHAKWLALFAEQVAIALENAQIYRQLDDYATEILKLYEATWALELANNLGSLSQQIVDVVVNVIGHVDCGLLLLDRERRNLMRLARAGKYQVQARQPLYLDGVGLVPAAIRDQKIIYAPDVLADERYLPNDSRTRSELVIPLHTKNGILGVLDLQSPELHAFDARDQRILQSFADRAGTMIENALIALILGGLILTLFLNSARNSAVLEIGEERSLETAAHLNRQHYAELERAINSSDPAGLDTLFIDEITDTSITRLRILSDGRVIFDSRNPGEAGDTLEMSEAMERAESYRKISSTLGDDHETVTTEAPLYALLENNQLGGQPIGVIEIERDLGATAAAIANQHGRLRWRTLLLATLILLALSGLVHYADQRLDEQRVTLERQNSRLMLQLISRADLSHMTVYALQDVFRKLEPALPDSAVAEGYNELEQLAKHLSLIHQLETGQLKPDKKPFSLDEMLSDRASQFKKGQVVLPHRSGLGVIADRAMLMQVVDALLNNIQEYNRRSSKVILTANAEDGVVQISAAVGVPTETGELEPLSINQRLDLTVARLIAEKHGGSLGFSYDTEHGARLHVQMPSV